MSELKYTKIISQAKLCQNNVKKKYKNGMNSKWSYYFAKSILNPKKNITKISFENAPNPNGTHISNQIEKNDFIDICKRLTLYVEKNKVLPNFVEHKGYLLQPYLLTEILSRILVWYDKYGNLPNNVNANSKVFTKPVETGNTVFDYACKKFNRKFTSLDDILEYVAKYFTYEFYFDDEKSNKEVTDTKAGNCTDLLQWLFNMAKALGYECKCVHVSCRVSGTGHVWGKFRHAKNTGGEWINRDIACCADNGSIRCVWCEDGYLNAYNPSWFFENLNR
jgi:hypothetical protein